MEKPSHVIDQVSENQVPADSQKRGSLFEFLPGRPLNSPRQALQEKSDPASIAGFIGDAAGAGHLACLAHPLKHLGNVGIALQGPRDYIPHVLPCHYRAVTVEKGAVEKGLPP